MSQPSIVSELIAEEQRLLRKLEKVRELRALYGPDTIGSAQPDVSQRQPSGPRIADDGVVLDAAANLIRGRTQPTRTREILDHLQKAGIHVGGKEPRNNLSSKLSHSPRFTAHGRSGWTLEDGRTESGDESHEAPDDSADPSASPGASFEAGVGLSGGLNGVNAP